MFFIHILSSWNAKEEASTFYLPGMPKKEKPPHSIFLECQRRSFHVCIHILSSWNAKEEEASTFYLPGMPKKKKLAHFIFLECQRRSFHVLHPHSVFLKRQRRRSFHTLPSWNAIEEASAVYLPGMLIFLERQRRRSFDTLSYWNAKEEAFMFYILTPKHGVFNEEH